MVDIMLFLCLTVLRFRYIFATIKTGSFLSIPEFFPPFNAARLAVRQTMLFHTEPPLWYPMEPHNITRKLVALLSADVQGYSRLMGDDEIATIRTVTAYRTLMTTLIQQYRGKVIDSPGDNLLAEFASALDGVQCAVAIQQKLQTQNAELAAHRQMAFRIGINVGDVVVEGERLYGDGVNIAARLEGLAQGGGICISGTVYDQVENKLPLGYEYLGEKIVKNISKPIRVYRVVPDVAVEPVHPVETPTARAATTPPQDKPSIAVLPFLNMSGDIEQEYFSDGITEDLLTGLSKLSGLLVISRNSVFQYKGKAVKPKDVSRDLGFALSARRQIAQSRQARTRYCPAH